MRLKKVTIITHKKKSGYYLKNWDISDQAWGCNTGGLVVSRSTSIAIQNKKNINMKTKN